MVQVMQVVQMAQMAQMARQTREKGMSPQISQIETGIWDFAGEGRFPRMGFSGGGEATPIGARPRRPR